MEFFFFHFFTECQGEFFSFARAKVKLKKGLREHKQPFLPAGQSRPMQSLFLMVRDKALPYQKRTPKPKIFSKFRGPRFYIPEAFFKFYDPLAQRDEKLTHRHQKKKMKNLIERIGQQTKNLPRHSVGKTEIEEKKDLITHLYECLHQQTESINSLHSEIQRLKGKQNTQLKLM